MGKRNVVITGMGIVSALGHDIDTYWNNLIEGKSGVRTITRFDTSKFNTRFGAAVNDFDPSPYFEPKQLKHASRFIQFAVAAVARAMEAAGVENNGLNKERCGVIIGSGLGGWEVLYENVIKFHEKGPKRLSPFFIPLIITNMASAEVARRIGWMGANYSISAACTTANHAIISAADTIRIGKADVMLAGGSEATIEAIGLAAFQALRALSTRNDEPEKASRPFDKDRDGFVMGEGAGVFILEEEEHAKARGAKILARYLGGGMSSDAHHMTQSREDSLGIVLAMKNALEDAGLHKEQVQYINAHATSTPLGDVAEAKAVHKLFNSHTKNIKISSTKSMLGHALGASGGLEMVATIQTLRTGVVHPTINVEHQDPECDVDCVPNESVEHPVEYAMSNSFGFGGHNSSILLGRYEE